MNKSKLYIILTMLIFGSIGLFVKEVNLPSSQIALTRAVIGSLFLFLTSFLTNKKISWNAIRPNLLLLILSGIAIGFNWILLFEAYKYTSISNATLSYYFAPVFVMFLSPFLLKERLTKQKIICILGAMAGMFLLVGFSTHSTERNQILGITFGLFAATLYASVILMNKFIKNISSFERTILQLSTSAIILLPYVLVMKSYQLNVSSNSILLLIFVGIVHTGIAYFIYFSQISKLTAQEVAVYSYIDPISAIILSFLFLGEEMSFYQLIGGILILGTTFLSDFNLFQRKKIHD